MRISIDELHALSASHATIINAGRHAGKREVRGAIRYRPDDLLTASQLTLPIAADRPIVLYAESGDDERLDELAEHLRASGYADVRILGASLDAYEAAGGPTQEASTEQMVPPSKPAELQALDRRL